MSTEQPSADAGRSDRMLSPQECARAAIEAAADIEPAALDRNGSGTAALLWRTRGSEAWLNTWWEARDTGFHDHDSSSVGVYLIAGEVVHETLVMASPRRLASHGPGEAFSLAAGGIHRMDHAAGAITVHVYSPPLRTIGCYELVDGELRRTPTAADQESPPSPALSALMRRL